jgi:hypothetical protein
MTTPWPISICSCAKSDEAARGDERASLLKQADEMIDKAKEIKQKKMETPAKS